jgi:uncharacterized MAPEG superfamily protein
VSIPVGTAPIGSSGEAMTPDLTYLAWTALLLALLWIPYFIGLTVEHGFAKPSFYRDPSLPRLPLWVQRANRAHVNLVQAFAPFAVLVLIAHMTGQANGATAFWAMVFFWSRVGHAIVHLLGTPYIRSVFFLIGVLAVVMLFVEVIA